MKRANRRMFLQGAAGASLLLPHLTSLMSKKAAAQAMTPKKRLLIIYIPQQDTEGLVPKTAPFSTVGSYLEPLEPWKNRLLLAHNLKGRTGHMEGHSECTTGFYNSTPDWKPTGGPSIDQMVAKRLGNVTPLASLELTAGSPWDTSTDDACTSWSDKVLPLLPVPDPQAGFVRVFGPIGSNPAGAMAPSQAMQEATRKKALQKSMLDNLIADYQKTSAKLSAGDRQLLDAHLAALRDQETKLQQDNSSSAACGAASTAPPVLDWKLFPERVTNHINTIVSAFRCDATRVASLLFGIAQEGIEHTWCGSNDNFHSVAHGDVGNFQQQHFAVRNWEAQQIAYLLKSLDAVKEGNGSLLDNTLILRITELGFYPWTSDPQGRHSREQVSALIIGDGGGYFKTGRMVDTQQTDYCNMLVSVVQAMGLTDVTTLGKFGTGPIAALRS